MKITEMNKEKKMISYLVINYWNRTMSQLENDELKNTRLIKDINNFDIPESLFDNPKRILQSFEKYEEFIIRVQPEKVTNFKNYVTSHWEKYAKTEILSDSKLSDLDYEVMVLNKMENIKKQITRQESLRLSESYHSVVCFKNPKRSDLESFNLKLERIIKDLNLVKDYDNFILSKRLERFEF